MTTNYTDCQQHGKSNRKPRHASALRQVPRHVNPPMDKKQRPQARNCLHCGGPYPHKGGRDACHASGQTCSACSKTGHFTKCCLSKPRQALRRREVREITEAEKPEPSYLSDTDEEFIYSINASSIKQPETIMQITNIPVKVIIDRGSSVNLLRVNVTKNQRKFKKSRTRTENRFGLFCICSKLEVCNKVKWG